MSYPDYTPLVRSMLKPERFVHSVNVAQQALKLAQHYHASPQLCEKAYTAGILHDICKNMSHEEQLHWIEKSGIILDDVIAAQPQVWHGIAASVYLKEELSIEDEDLLHAVRYHTLGRRGMSQLEMIVYLADLTSAERNYPDVDEMRQAVMRSLEEGMYRSLAFSLQSLLQKKQPIAQDSWEAYNQYLAIFLNSHSTR